MKILSAEQIRQWDAYTIQHEPIASVDLMERAVSACMEWLEKNDYLSHTFTIYCGKGNNGGDGLALARMLWRRQCQVTVYILEFGHKGSDDFQANLMRLHETGVDIFFIQSEVHFHPVSPGNIVIDALFGSGLNRPLEAVTGRLVEHINLSGNEVIAIDIPSGMFADKTSKGNAMIRAKHTLSFQSYKLAFLVPENEPYAGRIHILDIGLSPVFPEGIQADLELTEADLVKQIYRPRNPFSHKGTFGHSLLVAGSYGKIGAVVLSAKACLRTGTGLLSCYVPACGYIILQVSVPEAMVMTDTHEHRITGIDAELSRYSVVGIGPGLGTDPGTAAAMDILLSSFPKPVVIDADGLNILAANHNLREKLPPLSILTPHPKEFERLFGKSDNDFERIELARIKSGELGVIIVLKGHHTFIALPGGKGYFNSTGNPGMAKGGSGDVLTGILTSLLSQGYQPDQAAVAGVYLHGFAGDLAAQHKSEESMIASDIIDCLGEVFLELSK